MTDKVSAFIGAGIFDGVTIHTDCALVVRGTVIGGVVPASEIPQDAAITELDGGTIAPGYVDVQVNGGGGVMFNDDPSKQALGTIAEAHASLGATSILPTLITDTPEMTRAAIEAAAQAIGEGAPGIVGLHLEGPHLSLARKGAHDPALIRPMTDNDLAVLLDAAGRLPVLKVTIAPESVTPDQMRILAEAGVLLSLGHSDCSFEDAAIAVESGVRCVTHLFNAMSQLGNREPGVVGATLDLSALSAGLIADLIHVHPSSIAIALEAKRGPGRIFLVSDAMSTAGSDIDHFILNDRKIVRRDGRLTLADGTLAGADLDLTTAIRNVSRISGSLGDTLAMATSIPAKLIGLQSELGALARSRAADFVHISPDATLQGVWRGARSIEPSGASGS